MPPICIVKNCGNTYSRKPQVSSVSFHKLPKSDTEFRVWLRAINWQENWEPDPCNDHYRVCSKHFASDSFINGKKTRRLKPGAAPSVFDHFEPMYPECALVNTSENDVSNSHQNMTDNEKESELDLGMAKSPLACGSSETHLPPVTQDELELSDDVIQVDSQQCSQSQHNCATTSNGASIDGTPKRLRMKPIESKVRRKLKFLRPGRSKKITSKEVGTVPLTNDQQKRLLKQLRVYEIREKMKAKQLNTLRIRNRRAISKIDVLKGMLDQLRKNGLSESGAEAVNSCLSGTVAGTLVTEFLKKGKKASRVKFCDELKVFATTLHFHSPRAYEYVRSKLLNVLPHSKTIARWYRSFDGTPGFNDHALCVLKAKKDENPEKKLYCSLMFDEMHIRNHIEYDSDKQRFIGRVDFGDHIDDDSLPEAREALVFMISCINEGWKLPVGYFLTAGVSAEDKKNLVLRSLILLNDHGAEIVSLTFDGTQTNMSMARKLGAFSDHPYHTPYFQHPSDPTKIVFIFPDPCHMLKLVRNTFFDKKVFYVGNDTTEIQWEYLEALHKIQRGEGLVAANKLKDPHVNFVKQKMKVKLAAQLFSRSVATSIQYCRLNDFDGFSDSHQTEIFLLAINDVFDVLNSHAPSAPFFKTSLQQTNSASYLSRLEEVESLLERLYVRDSPEKDPVNVLSSSRKTGFLGFLICIRSLRGLYDYLIESKKIEQLPTYALSQDHLELFFGVIRSKGGFNDNPTAKQFATAYKKLLVRNEIRAIETGNCVPQEPFAFLCNLATKMRKEAEKQALHEKITSISLSEDTADHEYLEYADSDCLSTFSEDVISYIAGFVAKAILESKTFSCKDCRGFVLCNETIKNDATDLISLKSYGGCKVGLHRPSALVHYLCRLCERFFRMVLASSNGIPPVEGLEGEILRSVFENNMGECIFREIVEHDSQFPDNEKHAPVFIKRVVRKYLKIRLCHYARVRNSQRNAGTLRQVNKKSTLFNGN